MVKPAGPLDSIIVLVLRIFPCSLCDAIACHILCLSRFLKFPHEGASVLIVGSYHLVCIALPRDFLGSVLTAFLSTDNESLIELTYFGLPLYTKEYSCCSLSSDYVDFERIL